MEGSKSRVPCSQASSALFEGPQSDGCPRRGRKSGWYVVQGERVLGDAVAFGKGADRTDRTSLPRGAPVPHGSSVIIFTTAAIQQCRINSVRYCGRVGPSLDQSARGSRRGVLLNLSIASRILVSVRNVPLFRHDDLRLLSSILSIRKSLSDPRKS